MKDDRSVDDTGIFGLRKDFGPIMYDIIVKAIKNADIVQKRMRGKLEAFNEEIHKFLLISRRLLQCADHTEIQFEVKTNLIDADGQIAKRFQVGPKSSCSYSAIQDEISR